MFGREPCPYLRESYEPFQTAVYRCARLLSQWNAGIAVIETYCKGGNILTQRGYIFLQKLAERFIKRLIVFRFQRCFGRAEEKRTVTQAQKGLRFDLVPE